jgi:hypothetical protein
MSIPDDVMRPNRNGCPMSDGKPMAETDWLEDENACLRLVVEELQLQLAASRAANGTEVSNVHRHRHHRP